ASERLEWERMPQMIESRGFVTSTAESNRRARVEPGGRRIVRESSSYRDRSGERRSLRWLWDCYSQRRLEIKSVSGKSVNQELPSMPCAWPCIIAPRRYIP